MRIFGPSLFALLLGWAPASEAGAGAPPTLRVATYNIAAAGGGLSDIIATLVELRADVIGLQEVDVRTRRSGRTDQAAEIARALGFTHTFRRHFRYQGGELGLALVSRFPLRGVERHTVPRSNLALLSARVQTPSGDLTVVVVHLHPTMPFDDEANQRANREARLREARLARAIAARGGGPAVVVGDFNAASDSPTYALMQRSLRDACAGAALEKTWPSFLPITRIDYVWVTDHFGIADCDAVTSFASDHRPVTVDLQWRSPGS